VNEASIDLRRAFPRRMVSRPVRRTIRVAAVAPGVAYRSAREPTGRMIAFIRDLALRRDASSLGTS